MKRLITILLISVSFALPLYSEEMLRVVPVSTDITAETYRIISREVTSATLTGIPTYPRGVSCLNLLYKEVKNSFVNMDYPSVVTKAQRAISTVSSNLREMTSADWENAYRILKIGALSAFAMRKYPILDKILWNMIKWFPDRELKGRAIPPDLHLRWRHISDKMVRYRVEFDTPVSYVTIKVNGREINGFTVSLPAGVHQIYWKTPYESQVMIKHIYSNSLIKLDIFPVPVGMIREVVMTEGWCSGKMEKLFEDTGINYPLLFVSSASPYFILVDPVLKGVILKGNEEILPGIDEIMTRYQETSFTPPLECSWVKKAFYQQWWFYLGIGAIAGGVGAGIWYQNLGGSVVVSW